MLLSRNNSRQPNPKLTGMRLSGARPQSVMDRYDSRESTIERHSDDEAPMFYGLCYCRTWAGRYLHAVACPSFPGAEEELSLIHI